jgi:hypothetical protein
VALSLASFLNGLGVSMGCTILILPADWDVRREPSALLDEDRGAGADKRGLHLGVPDA